MNLRGIVACLRIWSVATQPKKTPASVKNDGVSGLLLSMLGSGLFPAVWASQNTADPQVVPMSFL